METQRVLSHIKSHVTWIFLLKGIKKSSNQKSDPYSCISTLSRLFLVHTMFFCVIVCDCVKALECLSLFEKKKRKKNKKKNKTSDLSRSKATTTTTTQGIIMLRFCPLHKLNFTNTNSQNKTDREYVLLLLLLLLLLLVVCCCCWRVVVKRIMLFVCYFYKIVCVYRKYHYFCSLYYFFFYFFLCSFTFPSLIYFCVLSTLNNGLSVLFLLRSVVCVVWYSVDIYFFLLRIILVIFFTFLNRKKIKTTTTTS